MYRIMRPCCEMAVRSRPLAAFITLLLKVFDFAKSHKNSCRSLSTFSQFYFLAQLLCNDILVVYAQLA